MPGAAVADAVLVEALDASPDGVLLFDRSGSILFANRSVRHVLGWDPDDLRELNVATLIHPEDLAATLATMSIVLSDELPEITPGLVRFRTADDDYRTVEMTGNLVKAADHPSCFVVCVRRVDERLLLSDAFERLSEHPDLHAVLRIIPAFYLWRPDAPHTTVVWRDQHGTMNLVGEPLPDRLVGAAGPDGDLLPVDGDPWAAAWRGEMSQRDDLELLPPRLAGLAEEHGLRGYWAQPVTHDDGTVCAVITLWSRPGSQPVASCAGGLRTMTHVASVAFRWYDQQIALRHQATHDELTGVANRRHFHQVMAEHAETHAEVGKAAALLLIDLDGFKPVNDQYGHGAGDVVLVEVARRLESSTRRGDLVGRLGGDEFAVLCPACDPEDARRVADRFLRRLDEPIKVGDRLVTIGASVGVCASADLITMAEADAALYEAKAAGGRQVVVRS